MTWAPLPSPIGVAIGDDASGRAIAIDGGAGGAGATFLVVDDDTGALGEYPGSALTFDTDYAGGDAEPDGTGTDEPDDPATTKAAKSG